MRVLLHMKPVRIIFSGVESEGKGLNSKWNTSEKVRRGIWKEVCEALLGPVDGNTGHSES